MLTKYKNKLIKIYEELDLSEKSLTQIQKDWITRLYLYYQYFNADETKIEELEELMIDNKFIRSYFISELEENRVDLISKISLPKGEEVNIIASQMKDTDNFIINVFNGNKEIEYKQIKDLFWKEKISSENQISIILLSEDSPEFDTKSNIKEFVTNYKSRLENINFIILFLDDILEIISDVESPSLFVKKAEFLLTDKDQFLFHGEEKSLVTSISAKSLKDAYIKYGTKGLFSSNLRYYVKSSKIDKSIKESIIFEPEKFWYFNNGLIITCEDYKIKSDKIELINFSIVNGGQTTNLIGNTVFEKDFSVICKIIKNKYDDKKDNTIFLGKVAETSNTQKPIRSRDLISNRIEQKNLQDQFYEINIFLEIKRGQKINKELYPERWQNAKNDEVGQMLFSTVYQHPGIARNSKSKMLENENYYNIIYRSNYNSILLLSLQHFKIGYNKWSRNVRKMSEDNNKVGLSRNGFLWFLAITGFLAKLYYNKEFQSIMKASEDYDDFTTDKYKSIISQNDIGEIGIFKSPSLLSELKNIEPLLDMIYEEIFLPSYQNFKKINPSIAYSNYTKNDTNYYRSVVPTIVNLYKYKLPSIIKTLENYFDNSDEYVVELQESTKVFEEYKPGLSEELTEYRRAKYHQSGYKIQAWEVFTNNQRSKMVHHKPRTKEELLKDCGLTDFSIDNYGEDILKIIDKYIIKLEI